MPEIQSTDVVEIASDAHATADVLPVRIKRVQEVVIFAGSLKDVDTQIAATQQRIDDLENTDLPNLRQILSDQIAFKASLQTEFDKQKPVSMDVADVAPKPAVIG